MEKIDLVIKRDGKVESKREWEEANKDLPFENYVDEWDRFNSELSSWVYEMY